MALQFQKLKSNFVGLYRVQNKTDFNETKNILHTTSEFDETTFVGSGMSNYC